MLGIFNIMLLADLSPVERWRGRNWPSHPVNLTGLQYVLIGAGLSLLIALAILIHRRLQAQALHRRFQLQAAQLGLSSEESQVLAMLAGLAGIKHGYTIFTMENAFERGVSALLTNERICKFTPQARGCLSDTLISLRQKLGFGSSTGLESEGLRTTRQVAEGAAITILSSGVGNPVNAVVAETNMLDMVIQPASAVDVKAQQKVALRYCDGRSIWEFDMPVIGVQGERITLAHVEQVRFINRRRFPRVPVSRPSRTALFPFIRPPGSPDLPQFEQGKLIEIAGPAIKLETPLRLERGNTVLTILDLRQDKSVQAMGRVVRTRGTEGGGCEAVVSLIATDAAGIDEMVHQTSLAEKENAPAPDNGSPNPTHDAGNPEPAMAEA